MAERLVNTGQEVTVWNRTPRPDAVLGAHVADSAAAAVAEADLVITMLADAAAVSDVLFGAQRAAAAMRPEALLIDMSTIGPHAVADIRRRLPENVGLVDAPVLGSIEPAAAGKLLVLAGGSEADLARCQKVLETFGEVRRAGQLGAGAALKVAVMGALVPVRVLLAEVLDAAEASGVGRDAVAQILDSRGFGAVAGRPEPAPQPRYSLAHAAKDLGLAIDAVGKDSVDLTIVAAALDRLDEAKQAGLGDRDLSAIYAYDMAHGRSTAAERRLERRNPPSVPAPIGAYSHAVRTGNLLFVSGQVAIDNDGQIVGAGDIEAQTDFVFDSLERILADQGATFDDVVSLRTYLLDMDSTLAGYRAVRIRRVTGDPPSSTTVEVTRLVHPDLLVEIDLVAALR